MIIFFNNKFRLDSFYFFKKDNQNYYRYPHPAENFQCIRYGFINYRQIEASMQDNREDKSKNQSQGFGFLCFIKRKSNHKPYSRRRNCVHKRSADKSHIPSDYASSHVSGIERRENKKSIFQSGKAQGYRNTVNHGIYRFIHAGRAKGDKSYG